MVKFQLVGRDDPQILRDPLEFMLAPHFMIDVKYNSWGNGVFYAEWLLEGLDYEEFNITRLMSSLTIQVYAQSINLFLSLFFLCLVENCNRGGLLLVSPLILNISIGWSMLMARMALLGSMLCPVTLMSWAIVSLPTLER